MVKLAGFGNKREIHSMEDFTSETEWHVMPSCLKGPNKIPHGRNIVIIVAADRQIANHQFMRDPAFICSIARICCKQIPRQVSLSSTLWFGSRANHSHMAIPDTPHSDV